LARVKSPVCERTILKLRVGLDHLLEALLAVDRRRRADGALQFDDVDVAALALHVLQQPAAGLAALFQEVGAHEGDVERIVLHVDRAVGQDHRDLGGLGFAQHGLEAVSTTGEKAITSTFCAMKERIALIWFSCFCCASANFSLMPASLAADLIDSVLAVRHSLSAPIWLKPSTIFFCAKGERQLVASARAACALQCGAAVHHGVSPWLVVNGNPVRGGQA
jgi:hypothetical protein